MPRWLGAVVLLVAGFVLIGVTTPPVIEAHLEAGFCSADCPEQHAGQGAAVPAPLAPGAGGRAPIAGAATIGRTDPEPDAVTAPSAPRAPPSA